MIIFIYGFSTLFIIGFYVFFTVKEVKNLKTENSIMQDQIRKLYLDLKEVSCNITDIEIIAEFNNILKSEKNPNEVYSKFCKLGYSDNDYEFMKYFYQNYIKKEGLKDD